ncbi:MAG: cytochrome ubiquinol oxidase subunit I, partial [Armatimonadetes bacterium]|nr:cytochrome ubiquinol oxidase subunit I [Armatimonadota bacterium]
SGYFIITTNAFMQNPVGYSLDADGAFQLASLGQYLLNPWAIIQYFHNQIAALVTGSFVMAAVGAFWTLRKQFDDVAKISLRTGITAGLIAAVLVAFPTGHEQGRMIAKHQPVTLAAMEGRFESGSEAGMAMIGQPNVEERKLDNPIAIPSVLSWIAYGNFSSNVKGLNEFPETDWPKVEMLYYAFHIMVGLGTLFILLMLIANIQKWRGALEKSKPLLWIIAFAFPFPFIANIAGWATAEFGRQPWLVYGLMRTSEGGSPTVHSGATLFSTLGFAGIYFVLGILYLHLVAREIGHGPQPPANPTDSEGAQAA